MESENDPNSLFSGVFLPYCDATEARLARMLDVKSRVIRATERVESCVKSLKSSN